MLIRKRRAYAFGSGVYEHQTKDTSFLFRRGAVAQLPFFICIFMRTQKESCVHAALIYISIQKAHIYTSRFITAESLNENKKEAARWY